MNARASQAQQVGEPQDEGAELSQKEPEMESISESL